MSAEVYIGTSGWNYKHWRGPFYPEDLPDKEMLSFYAEHFDTVEINNTFYHLPSFKTLKTWRETVPRKFTFAVKASRFITHMKKLKAPKTSTKKFFTRVERLEDKLGPILFQLPPHWGCDADRLADFLDALPSRRRYGFEFRDQSWHTEEVYDLLKKHNAALCIYDLAGKESPLDRLCRIVSTSNFEEVVKAHQRLADRSKSRLLLLQQRSKRSRGEECEIAD